MSVQTLSGTRVCTRPSTLAKALDAMSDGLLDYAAATAVQTIVGNGDLLTRARLLDPDAHWRSFKPLVKEAKQRRGKVEASAGTGIHGTVEAMIQGRDVSGLPDEVTVPARMVMQELDALGVEVVRTEQFVAALGIWPEDLAGTADLVLRHAGRLYIGDVKSVEQVGKNTRFSAMAWCCQMTVYSRGNPLPAGYVPDRDRWGRPIVDIGLMEQWPEPMSQQHGLIIEVARDGSGSASHEIELDADLVRLACEVRAARKKERV
jgi:hypothetical protein